jgi:hypothetical protein
MKVILSVKSEQDALRAIQPILNVESTRTERSPLVAEAAKLLWTVPR